MVEALISALVTLVAAFAGSWSAFKLEDRAKSRQRVRDQVAAINRAQFALIQQFNELKNIQSKMIDAKRDDPLRFITMRPSLPFGDSITRLDVTELLFLLETDDRELPFLMMLEQRRFETAIQAVNERSSAHISELQPRLLAAGVREGSSWTLDSLNECLGDDIVLRLQRATDAAVEQVDLTVESCAGIIDTFYKAMKARFPNESIIRMAPGSPSTPLLKPASSANVSNSSTP
jgi:hypothetical protein